MKHALHWQKKFDEAFTKIGLRIENHTSLDLLMVIGSASLLVSQLNTQLLPLMFTIEISLYLTEVMALHHFRE